MARERFISKNRVQLASIGILLVAVILTATVSVSPFKRSKKAEKLLMAQMEVDVSLEGAIQFKAKFGSFPKNATELLEGIWLLHSSDPLPKSWSNQEGELVDPWGSRMIAEINNGGFAVKSCGPDMKMGSRDDVVSDWVPFK